ncbi:MAG: hypothetical protein IGR80_01005 [Synechococcales cyanobacterium K44_A2020_017]|nr:hypothetical protein [Synechococcales cyanobacterium K32_A2020_035]MBF2093322.1 hypothetical protein [Synechococcales cyanobacterium K44_A2020_017]
MADWEFLIQQEGDRSWLPLDTPDVEILEGRYRVVARSTYANRSVEVRITHDAVYEEPPKRRTQARSAQTNRDGLMMVIPFTRLQPGTWEIRCISDVMADLMGEGWQQRVLLHVLPHEAQVGDDWGSDWSPAVDEDDMVQADAQTAQASGEDDTWRQADEPMPADPDDTWVQTETSVQPEPAASSEGEPEALAAEEDGPDAIAPFNDGSPTAADDAAALSSDSDSSDRNSEPAAEPNPDTSEFGQYVQAVDDVIDAVFQQFQTSLDPHDATPAAEAIAPPDPDPSANDPTAPTPEEVPLDASVEAPPDDAAPPAPPLPLTLRLTKEVYLLSKAGNLTLGGELGLQTDAPAVVEGDDLDRDRPATSYQLRLRLTDPQSGRSLPEQIYSLAQPLTRDHLPLAFRCDFQIEPDSLSHLLLGELDVVAADHPTQAIATQSLTVTVDLDNLLNAIANETPASELFQPPLNLQGQQVIAPDLTFLNFLSSPPQSTGLTFQTSGLPSIAPPLRSQRSPETAEDEPRPAKPIDLPSFKPLPSAEESSDLGTESEAELEDSGSVEHDQPESDRPSDEAEFSANDLADDEQLEGKALSDEPSEQTAEFLDVDPDQPPLDSEPEPLVDEARHPELDRPQEPNLSVSLPIMPLPAPTLEPEPEPVEIELSPEDSAFQSLNLGDRFQSRLLSLAQDVELAEWLGAVSPPSRTPVDPEAEPKNDLEDTFYSVTSEWQAAPNSWDGGLADEEIVMDDSSDDPAPPTSPALTPPPELCLPEDQAIPTPVLELPGDDLTAGTPTRLRLSLPNLPSKIYVKVWLHDCQQRVLVDGPHWVSNFLPNSQGHLEGSLTIAVPLGCMEVRFEAIAVEMLTQRESRKVSVTRWVMPPNLPDLALDELDV